MNAGYGDEGFSFNASGLISDNELWRGWLGKWLPRSCEKEVLNRNSGLTFNIACDWYHGVPQVKLSNFIPGLFL